MRNIQNRIPVLILTNKDRKKSYEENRRIGIVKGREPGSRKELRVLGFYNLKVIGMLMDTLTFIPRCLPGIQAGMAFATLRASFSNALEPEEL